MDVIMPQLGETVLEGTVTAWHKKVGEAVRADEPLFDVETDKVTSEIPAPASGMLAAILVETGVAVAVGTKLAVIEAGSGAVAAAVESVSAPTTASAPKPSEDDNVVLPHSKLRRQTAAHMVRSVATSPHVLQAVEVDYERVEQARAAWSAGWKATEGFTLTYLPFVARAVCEAIAEFPWVNASYTADALIVHKHVHLGIAVDLEFQGLVVPVIRDAHRLGVFALAKETNRVATAARRGLLKPDDIQGGTYTLSNSGSYGTFLTAPLIHQPQVAILSTDGVRKRPAVVEGPDGDVIAIRSIGMLAHSFDHRAFDGAYSAAFLRRVKQLLESKDWLAARDLPLPPENITAAAT